MLGQQDSCTFIISLPHQCMLRNAHRNCKHALLCQCCILPRYFCQHLQLALTTAAATAGALLVLPAGGVGARGQVDARVGVIEVDRLQVEAHLQSSRAKCSLPSFSTRDEASDQNAPTCSCIIPGCYYEDLPAMPCSSAMSTFAYNQAHLEHKHLPRLLQLKGADAYRLPRHDWPVLDTGHMRDSEGVPDHHILILDAAVLHRPSDLSVSILPPGQ